MTEPPIEPSFTTVKFRLLDKNYELLYSAAAFQGESLEATLNRACALYEAVHRAEPGEVMAWKDSRGNDRQIAVLPAVIGPGPRWLRWLGVNVSVYASPKKEKPSGDGQAAEGSAK